MRDHQRVRQANGFNITPPVKKILYLRGVLLIDKKLIIKDFPRTDDGAQDAEEWLLNEAAKYPEAESISGHIITCADRKEV